METSLDEIAPDIFRLSTLVPEIGPEGFTFNQFLILDEQPLLFHTGHRSMFPSIQDAIERVMPLERLRWISFGHVESDECGAMNQLLGSAPQAQVMHGAIGCMVSVNEMADRAPRPLVDGEVIELGTMRVRHIDTAHVPHGWDAGVLFEEVTSTLFCGDLFTHLGQGPALTTSDLIEPSMEAEAIFRSSSLAPDTPDVMRRLAELAPATLALMHGSSFAGECSHALHDLADSYAATYFSAP